MKATSYSLVYRWSIYPLHSFTKNLKLGPSARSIFVSRHFRSTSIDRGNYSGYYTLLLDTQKPQSNSASTGRDNTKGIQPEPPTATSTTNTVDTAFFESRESSKEMDMTLLDHIKTPAQLSLYVSMLTKPTPPTSEDCCMGGCAVCVWDIYGDEFDEYKHRVELSRLKGEAWKMDIKADVTADEIDPSIKAFRDLERSKK